MARMRARIACLAAAAFLASCAALPPPSVPGAAEPQRAAPPAAMGRLADLEAGVRARHGPARSGFLLLDTNDDGLRWRLALVDSAREALDLQYYVWWGDESGELLLRRVVQAADRGVRVRLVVDDLSTLLEDETHPRVRDDEFLGLNAHPNISVRYFNAWRGRSLPERAVELLERAERLNHRMHNKLLVADNRAAVIGGRNIGNEYFGLSAQFNFRDLDVMGVGPVARQASEVFDAFWNSGWVLPAPVAAGSPPARDPEARGRADSQVLARFPGKPRDWAAELDAALAAMHAGESRVHTDRPDGDRLRHHMPAALRELVGGARREVLVTNAYVIPDERDIDLLRGLAVRGVRVRLLTNSLASHDVPAVNSHYKAWRKPLIEAGVELHEARHDASTQPALADTAPVRAAFMGLHVKAMVIDRERVFVGSMNLDPRSAAINTEMGVVIDSAGLAAQLAAAMERDMAAANAWRVTLDEEGALLWTAGALRTGLQPARSLWQRVEDLVFMLFPRDLY
jgi:putative cardiolipin synthase